MAEPYGFRACWSTPILAHSGKALGSFAMYYREPRSPGPAETQALEMATHLAGIAIERKRAREERETIAPGAGGSRARKPGDHHGRADRFPGARSESTDCRRCHQRQYLLALA